MMAAHEIARDHFDVESGDANIAALKYLFRYLKKKHFHFETATHRYALSH